MEFIAKTRKIGGSVIATIPKNVVESVGIKANQLILMDVKKSRKDFFGAFKGIGSFTESDRLDID